MQYCSLSDLDGSGDVDGLACRIGFATDWVAAHLAFDAALVTAVRSGADTLLQDFLEYGVMEGGSPQRGE